MKGTENQVIWLCCIRDTGFKFSCLLIYRFRDKDADDDKVHDLWKILNTSLSK